MKGMDLHKLVTGSQQIYYSGFALWISYNGPITRYIQIIFGYATGVARIIAMLM